MDREASIRHYKENLTQIKIFTETKNSQSKKYERTVSFNLHLKSKSIYYISTLGIRRSGRMILLWYR